MNGDCSDSETQGVTKQIRKVKIKKGFKMTIAERIAAAQARAGMKQKELDVLNAQEELTEADMAKMGELTVEIKTLSDNIERFEKMEVSQANVIVKAVEPKAEILSKDEAKKLGSKKYCGSS